MEAVVSQVKFNIDQLIENFKALNKKTALYKQFMLIVGGMKKYGHYCPTIKTIGRLLGYDRSWIQRINNYLSDLGLITVIHRFRKTAGLHVNDSNLYVVNWQLWNYFFKGNPFLQKALREQEAALFTNNLNYDNKPLVHTVLQEELQEGFIIRARTHARNLQGEKFFHGSNATLFKGSVMTPERRQILQDIQEGKDINPFSPVISSITEINLTTAGKCALSEYPDDVILQALRILRSARNVINPYAFLMSTIKELMAGAIGDWQWKKDLARALQIDFDGPKYVPRSNATLSHKQATRSSSLSGELPSSDSERGSGITVYENNYSQKGEIPAAPVSRCRHCLSSRHPTHEHVDTIKNMKPIQTVQPHSSFKMLFAMAHAMDIKSKDPFLLKYYELSAAGKLDEHLRMLINAPLDSGRPPQEQIDEREAEYEALIAHKNQHEKDNERYAVDAPPQPLPEITRSKTTGFTPIGEIINRSK